MRKNRFGIKEATATQLLIVFVLWEYRPIVTRSAALSKQVGNPEYYVKYSTFSKLTTNSLKNMRDQSTTQAKQNTHGRSLD